MKSLFVRPVSVLFLTVFISGLSLAGEDRWQSVRIVNNHSDAAGCTSAGMVHGSVDTFWMQNTASLYSALKKQADKKGANLVVLIGGVTERKKERGNELMADGEAFICGDRVAPALLPAPESQSVRATPTGPPPSAAGTPCADNLDVKGSMLRGTTFYTYIDLPGLDKETAMKNLISLLSTESLTLIAADESSGMIETQGPLDGGRHYAVDFGVARTTSGVRLAGTIKFPIGVRATNDRVRDDFCRFLTSIVEVPVIGPSPAAAEAPAAAARAPIAVADPSSEVEIRLKKLDDLKRKGLITEAEYKKKREEILQQF